MRQHGVTSSVPDRQRTHLYRTGSSHLCIGSADGRYDRGGPTGRNCWQRKAFDTPSHDTRARHRVETALRGRQPRDEDADLSEPTRLVRRIDEIRERPGRNIGAAMPQFAALTYTSDVDWTAAEQADTMAEYSTFGSRHAAVIRGGAAFFPTGTATTVHVAGGRGGEITTRAGAYADTTHALTGFYLVEAPDMPTAIQIAADIPAARDGAVELRPVIDLSGGTTAES